MKRSTKELLFNIGKVAVVACYAAAAIGWARVENPWKKGGVLDDEEMDKDEAEKEKFEKEFEEINKRWEEANEKIKNKE